MAYINTKQNNKHYRGKVWITKGDRKGKNICVEMANGKLMVISFVSEVTENEVKNAIEAMGWNLTDWL